MAVRSENHRDRVRIRVFDDMKNFRSNSKCTFRERQELLLQFRLAPNDNLSKSPEQRHAGGWLNCCLGWMDDRSVQLMYFDTSGMIVADLN